MVLLKGCGLIAALFVLLIIMGKVNRMALFYLKQNEPPPGKKPAE
jgi:hypothetical protein